MAGFVFVMFLQNSRKPDFLAGNGKAMSAALGFCYGGFVVFWSKRFLQPKQATPLMFSFFCHARIRVFERSGALDGVLPGPLPGGSLVTGAVGLVDVCNLRNQRVVGVGVCEHRANGEEH